MYSYLPDQQSAKLEVK